MEPARPARAARVSRFRSPIRGGRPCKRSAMACALYQRREALEQACRQPRTNPAPNSPTDRLAGLTFREREVVDRLVAGLSNKEIARELGISYRTVEVHRARIMDKTRARSFSELVRLALGVDHPHSGTSNPVETLAPALVDGR